MMIAIKEATAQDYDKLLKLIRRHAPDHLAAGMEKENLSLADFESFFTQTGSLHCIQSKKRIIGFYWLEMKATVLLVRAFVITRFYQKRGIRSTVLKMLEKDYGRHFDNIDIDVYRDDKDDIRLYQTHGFKPAGRADEYGLMHMRKTRRPEIPVKEGEKKEAAS